MSLELQAAKLKFNILFIKADDFSEKCTKLPM